MPVYQCAQHGVWRPPHIPKAEDCDHCWALYGRWRRQQDLKQAVVSKGRAKGGGQSAKKKGRAACLAVQEALLAAAPWLDDTDIYVKATSQLGVDLHLSPKAREWFKYAIEAKNVEQLNIWKALKQAESNATPDSPPVVIFKRALTPLYAALPLSEFLKLLPCPSPDLARLPSPLVSPLGPQ